MDIKPQKHLINILGSTRDHHPNFALLLGAGASVTSGVNTAGQMIYEWEQQHYNAYALTGEDFTQYINRQKWCNRTDKYSLLFESLYDEPSQRREYIETCLKNAKPSWGYIYLVNLLGKRVFNTVFTTNFDDLLNEACYTFSSDVRPIVCAHDSSIRSIRITSQRPKIIKLHGDFLFDNIKNTTRELETLEQNMLEKFKQYAAEFGIIVVGYSGNDRSIMDAFNMLLKNDLNFPHGIYWCVRDAKNISQNVDNLTRHPKFKLVEIDGFDELFAAINDSMNLDLQPEMADPYTALNDRLNGLIRNIGLSEQTDLNPIIKKDISELAIKIKRKANIQLDQGNISLGIGSGKLNLPVPFSLLAEISERNNKISEAVDFIFQELEYNPTPKVYTDAFRILFKAKATEKINDLFEKCIKALDIFKSAPAEMTNIALVFIENKEYDKADTVLDLGAEISKKSPIGTDYNIYRLNKLQILKHKKEDLTKEDKEYLVSLLNKDNPDIVLGALILLDKFKEAEDHLENLRKKRPIIYMNSWPIIKLLKPHLINKNLFPD